MGSSNSASGYNFDGNWGMALWTGSGVPSRSQCATLLSGSGADNGLTAADNALICVKTLYKRVALVQIQSVDTANSLVSAYARVWADAMS